LYSDQTSPDWWKLTPDVNGNYQHGTWNKVASAPPDYAPLYFASATLPDGRLIVEGGEYLFDNPVWTTKGAIYDPVADKWTAVQPPAEFPRIGDASSIVLPDGSFMLTDCCDTTDMAILDPKTLTWTSPIGTGKADMHDEESWAELPDGRILTVDANNFADLDRTEVYDPKTQLWTQLGKVPVHIVDTDPNPALNTSHEVGPEILRPDGTVVAIGGTGHNAMYDIASDTWTAMPDTPPVGFASTDGAAAMLPNGDIMFAASAKATEPDIFGSPTHFYEVHGSTITMLDPAASQEPPNSPTNSSYNNFFLMLPTGEVILSDFSGDLEIYTPAPGVTPAAMPQILGAPELIGTGPEAPTGSTITLYRGRSYTLPVMRMNGISQGAYYGDDVQVSTDFPLVRVTNTDSGHVAFCRTYDHSNRSIAADEVGTTKLDVPMTAEEGLASLVVIANGIASEPITVNIK
jgi:hypothetical protein